MMTFVLFIFWFYQFLNITSILASCDYRNPGINQMIHGVEIDPKPPGSRIKRSLSSSLRIHFEYMDSFESYTAAAKIKKYIMEPSKLELESVLRAKNPTDGILRVDRPCINNKRNLDSNGQAGCAYGCVDVPKCLSVSIPDKFLKKCRIVSWNGDVYYSDEDGEGVIDVDIVLLVSVEHCTGDTYAHATSCYTEKQLDRPILGIINMCHGVLEPDRNVRETINLVKHEIIHTLGFAVDKYAFYRYPDGSPIVPRNSFGLPNLGMNRTNEYYLWNEKITKKVVRTRYSIHGAYTKIFDAFVLPNVVQVAREYFNCPQIDAVDLEDFGGTGSALTHFDEYFLYNEIMTAETNKGIDALSKFTLALLKDTGWYEVDYSAAEEFYYGQNTGCDLPLLGCFKYMENRRYKRKSINPFCERKFPQNNVARCSTRRKYYDFCYLTFFNSISEKYQYFSKLANVPNSEARNYAGKSEYNEFCPTKIVFSDPSSICSDENNNWRRDRKNIIQSYFGPDSLCFENGVQNEYVQGFYGASCQKYQINKEKTRLTIYYGSRMISCPSNDIYYLHFDNIANVTVKCPDNLKLFPMLNGVTKSWGWRHYHFLIIFGGYLYFT